MESFIVFFTVFAFFWLSMFFEQFRSPKNYKGYVDIKNYAFCSNVTLHFPKWLVGILFFNTRLVKLPVTIVGGQLINYGLFMSFCVQQFITPNSQAFYIPLLKVWGIVYIALLIIICIDFEIYYFRHKNRRL